MPGDDVGGDAGQEVADGGGGFFQGDRRGFAFADNDGGNCDALGVECFGGAKRVADGAEVGTGDK